MRLFRIIGNILIGVVLVAVSCGGYTWFTGCQSVEQRVDSGQLQLRWHETGWFIFGPPGFSQTPEYLSHLAGLLGKRISTTQDGWEKFKLTSHCGGSKVAGAWAWAKGISPDGTKAPRLQWPPLKPLPTSQLVVLIPVAAILIFVVGFSLRRRYT